MIVSPSRTPSIVPTTWVFVLSLFTLSSPVLTQPRMHSGEVRFVYPRGSQKSVSLVGDFNSWSRDSARMTVEGDTVWAITVKLSTGVYQYKFMVDGTTYELDPANPVQVPNYNNSGFNSVFSLSEDGSISFSSTSPARRSNPGDVYASTPGTKSVYLNIIWHQHQPLYVDAEKDQLQGPWVRTHATKDYYDMAAMLREYPNVHCNINLTTSLLFQLQEYYVERLKPYVDQQANRVDANAFLAKWKGKTDPWIDIALTPTSSFTDVEKSYLYRNTWNAFGISEVMLDRFPEYKALKVKLEAHPEKPADMFTEQELRDVKFWFYLAYFDPDFLRGGVRFPDGNICDVSDYLNEREGKFYLTKRITEDDCNRIVAEAYKVSANIVRIHKELLYSPDTHKGQVELITTPFYHPILPLIYDSDLARECQPTDSLPARFSFPEDADAQVAKAVRMFSKLFGTAPRGMWPGEGSVAQPVLTVFRQHGIEWIASDVKILQKSTPERQRNTKVFAFPTESATDGEKISIAFRDTELSDRIGFTYQNLEGEDAAEDFIQSVLDYAPKDDEDDVLLTVILDGENAWEWYRKTIDGKDFLHAFYRKLSKLYTSRQIITTTTSEYMAGNPDRGINPHPVENQKLMKRLFPGSWINGNFDTWIGEEEENKAWEYLRRTREDLALSGVARPLPESDEPARGTSDWNAWKAWEEMYAAEGSDWFWWYGDDQLAPAGDKPFDTGFRVHLENVYKYARPAGSMVRTPRFPPIIVEEQSPKKGQGTMARSLTPVRHVVFTCDARKQNVPNAIFISGNLVELGSWKPNFIRMFDDGTHGDEQASDGVWSLAVDVSSQTSIEYKYTNSGGAGRWVPGEEFPVRHRTFVFPDEDDGRIDIRDIFGDLREQ
ncbi:MAG TPA: carbohydrate-binding module family 20 domain-containing protein [Bacteroidota bacterium]